MEDLEDVCVTTAICLEVVWMLHTLNLSTQFCFLHLLNVVQKRIVCLASIYNPQIEAKSHVTSGGSTNLFYCYVD
jgi:hypothetical protein